jgi:hypothetical protein
MRAKNEYKFLAEAYNTKLRLERWNEEWDLDFNDLHPELNRAITEFQFHLANMEDASVFDLKDIVDEIVAARVIDDDVKIQVIGYLKQRARHVGLDESEITGEEGIFSDVNIEEDNEGAPGHLRSAAARGAVRAQFDPSRHGNVDPGVENQSLLHHSERAALRRGEQLQLPTVNDVPEALEALKRTGITGPNNAVKWMTRVIEYNNIEVPPKYRPIEAIVKAAMKRSEDQEDDLDPDETALGKAFAASQTAEGATHTGSYDLGPDRSEEQETHKPYISSYMPFHRDEDDKLKPSKKIFAVLDKRGNAIFTSNNKDEAYKWFDDNFKRLRDEDQELPVGHPLHPDEEAKERESRKKFIKSGSNRGPRIRNTKGELGRSKWPERAHG